MCPKWCDGIHLLRGKHNKHSRVSTTSSTRRPFKMIEINKKNSLNSRRGTNTKWDFLSHMSMCAITVWLAYSAGISPHDMRRVFCKRRTSRYIKKIKRDAHMSNIYDMILCPPFVTQSLAAGRFVCVHIRRIYVIWII